MILGDWRVTALVLQVNIGKNSVLAFASQEIGL
jgi:hypothetical protein